MERAMVGRATAAVLAAAVLVAAPLASAQRPPTATKLERATERFLHRSPAAHLPPAPEAYGAPPLPTSRIVALYGAPQMGQTVLGDRSAPAAVRKLVSQARPYATLGDRPAVGELDLVSVFATASPGVDRLYRTRQAYEVIEIYLAQARKAGARLMLDIQPGRSRFATEVEALSAWVEQPDVDVALDPEWNVGRRGVPGQTAGRVTAREVNTVSRRLAAIVRANGLPPKLLVVHQFDRRMIQ